MAKISVILTVKDNETNLKECLNSLLKQTYKDIEVICLHDFDSRDILTQIVEAFAKADGRVIPFQTGLTGIADTKNSALDKVTGEYCYFIDSDDIITYPRLFEYAVTVFNNFDIIYLITGGGPAKLTETVPIYAYNQGWGVKQLGRSSAVSMLLLLFLLIICMFYFRLLDKWDKEGEQ